MCLLSLRDVLFYQSCFSSHQGVCYEFYINLLVFVCQDPPEYVTLPVVGSGQGQTIDVTLNGRTSECQYMVEQQKAYSIILYADTAAVQCKLVGDPQTALNSTECSGLVKDLRRTSSGFYRLRV